MTLSDKVAVLFGGEIQQLASPREIYQRPANQFVAGFVGSPQMNLLELDCQENTAMLGHFPIPLTDTCSRIHLGGRGSNSKYPDQIVLGIRPEDIQSS
jgi:multiple sugar transport system ATP-binding protein